MAVGKRKYGRLFTDWDKIEKIYRPQSEEELTVRYVKEAGKANFTNPYIRKCLQASPVLSPYDNGLSTGNAIDGQRIKLSTIEKQCGTDVIEAFLRAIEMKQEFHSTRFDFNGYDGTLWVAPHQDNSNYTQPGDVQAGFNKEYKGCANCYYYLLVNQTTFVGYDVIDM